MQGTVMMLMALSGLGCHNKGYDVVYAAPTYSGYGSGCYANVYPTFVSPQSYAGCYVGGYSGCYADVYGGGCFGGGCYGGGLSSCYSACYGGGHHGCGLLARLFSCCSFKRHGCYSYGYGDGFGMYEADFYGAPYGDLPYSPSINGYARAFNYGVGAPGEAEMGYMGGMQGADHSVGSSPAGTRESGQPDGAVTHNPSVCRSCDSGYHDTSGRAKPAVPNPPKPNT